MRVRGIAGSLRARSYTRALLRAAAELAPEGLVAGAAQTFDDGRRLTGEPTRAVVGDYLVRLRDRARRLRR